jgi:WhiB family redox-sensing transcriptional regulator
MTESKEVRPKKERASLTRKLVFPDFDLSEALCAQVDPEVFFTQDDNSGYKQAKVICTNCTVMAECLTWALRNDERYGVWGGLAPKERDQLKKRGTVRARGQTVGLNLLPRGRPRKET